METTWNVETGFEQTLNPDSSPLGATRGSSTGSATVMSVQAALELPLRNPKLPCFSLGNHQKLENFVGRHDVLETIDKYLLPPAPGTDKESDRQSSSSAGDEIRSFAICGLGGIGKTQLAVQYAFTRRNQFEAIFWLKADDEKNLAADFGRIAQLLGLEGESNDFAASRDIAMCWLAQPLKNAAENETPDNFVNWLIIFDNVDNVDVLSEFWPKLGRGAVLVTSRDPFAKHNLYMRHGLNLAPLSAPESEKLMQKLTHVKVEPSQQAALSHIAAKLGGLPLAIDLMSGVFRRMRLSYLEFLEFSNEEGIVKMFERPVDAADTDRVRSLTTIWSLDRLSKKTMVLLQVICLLDPDGIPEHVLLDGIGAISFDGYPQTRGEYYTARAELLASSLVDRNIEQERLFIHRLVQETAKETMSAHALRDAYLAASSLIAIAWPFQSLKEHHSIARFPKCEPMFPSVLRLKTGLESLVSSSPQFPVNISMARLLNDTGWYVLCL